MGGLVGLYLRASRFVSLHASGSLATQTAHFLTGESLGRGGVADTGRDITGATANPDLNPNYDWRYDAPGRRFRFTESSVFGLSVAGVLQFSALSAGLCAHPRLVTPTPVLPRAPPPSAGPDDFPGLDLFTRPAHGQSAGNETGDLPGRCRPGAGRFSLARRSSTSPPPPPRARRCCAPSTRRC